MFHRGRTWCRGKPRTPDELARMVTEQTWTLCSAFEVEGSPEYLFLNDSLSGDGAQEYVVVKRVEDGYRQIESITFGWCSYERALRYIEITIAGEFDDIELGFEVTPCLQTLEEHGRCSLCA